MGFASISREIYHSGSPAQFGPRSYEAFDAQSGAQHGPISTELYDALSIVQFGPISPELLEMYHIPLLRLEQVRAPLLAVLRSADMNSTSDQPISISATGYVIRRVIVTGASVSLTTAVGGIYTGPGKTGTAIVPAAQNYSALTSASKFIDASQDVSTTTDTFTGSTIYLSLTTPQGSPATADVYIYGDSVEL